MKPEEIKADMQTVSAGLGIGLLLAQGTIKPKPSDIEAMHVARDAFNRLRLEILEPRR